MFEDCEIIDFSAMLSVSKRNLFAREKAGFSEIVEYREWRGESL
jgi:hypothetical protein